MAITSKDVFNYKEASFEDLLAYSAKLALKNEYDRKAKLYCLTRNSMTQEEKDEAIEELAEIYISTFLEKLSFYINRINKYEDALAILKDNYSVFVAKHIDQLKNTFEEWDKEL